MSIGPPLLPTAVAVTLRVIEEVRQRQVRPVATYRFQLHRGFTLLDATALVPYLHELGISHVYCSPYLRAKAGSTHGYDTCDHSQIDPQLGGEEAYREFTAALAQHGMGHILDFVPNHMAANPQNPWWYDVLENGQNSPYAQFFDIDWQPVKQELESKILLPVLGGSYGEALEHGQLQIEYQGGAFHVRYYQLELPLGPKSAIPLLTHRLDELRAKLGAEHAELIELESIITGLEHMPPRTARELASVRERQREKEVIKRRLRELTAASEAVRTHIEQGVADYNGHAGEPASFDLLHRLLDDQAYRLCNWRAAFDEINYRRFFDVNELAAIAMEAPDVFWRSHELVRSLLVERSLDGLRIDHIDGLFDPERYLLRLQWAHLADLAQQIYQRLLAESTAEPTADDRAESPPATPPADWNGIAAAVIRLCCEQLSLPAPVGEDWRAILGPEAAGSLADEAYAPADTRPAPRTLPLYVVVEKILGPDEPLPESWPTAGTSGYDFVNTLNGLFVAQQGWNEIVRSFQRFVRDDASYEQVMHDSKRLILRAAMSSELLMLAHRLNRLSEQHRRSRDLTLNMLRLAAREVLASFPVYRIYPRKDGVSDRDRRFVDLAVAKARRQNPTFDPAAFDFVRNLLLLHHPPELAPETIQERELLAGRFQQVTSPVMAKGVEDTAFYVWLPLASVNEVGGDPRRPTTTPAQFHAQNQERAGRLAGALLATSTHDTKRSEDLRARLNVLSEIPRDWRSAVQRWSRLNRRRRREVDGEPAPSVRDEYLFYQMVVGIWPPTPPDAATRATLTERLQAYMEKATHEAKQRTSWINPNKAYDDAVREFVSETLREAPQNRFLTDLQEFCGRIGEAGQLNALSQLALKLLSPGVPDIYQGQELWDYSLVDPDNRRPVNFAYCRQALEELKTWETQAAGERQARTSQLGQALFDPRLKLLVTRTLLRLRQRRAALWAQGEYVPLEVGGPLADHLVALAWRNSESHQLELIAAIPRFLHKLKQQAEAEDRGWCLAPRLWSGTTVQIPGGGSGMLQSIFTTSSCGGDVAVLDVGPLLADFPLVVLERV
jgi:(1->4)-alpha-D-glucan 1-alpha-D-glucosylmutase